MDKVDLYKLYWDEYLASSKEPRFIRSLKANFLTLNGHGDPRAEQFKAKARALYSVAYGVRTIKRRDGEDFTICKLEAIWWGDEEEKDFAGQPRDRWNWKLLIRVASSVREMDRLASTLDRIEKGKNASVVNQVRLETIKEGLCVQMLHIGPYDNVAETIEKMRAFSKEKGLYFSGNLHEIYLSDPRRAAAKKLRTILRVPVEKFE
ncbi:MAG: GyrI-like domain-containing protein [Verrucomicrobiota bacterium]